MIISSIVKSNTNYLISEKSDDKINQYAFWMIRASSISIQPRQFESTIAQIFKANQPLNSVDLWYSQGTRNVVNSSQNQ